MEISNYDCPPSFEEISNGDDGMRTVILPESPVNLDDEVFEIRSTEEEEEVFWTAEEEEEEETEEVRVAKALHKCSKISADLRQELYGSSDRACDRYSEVEASSVQIITKEDIYAACAREGGGSDFEPVLKPYQLVGVNFLLLLYKKKIGGAILADEMGLGKTVQAITYLSLLKHLENDPGPHLIVCPASVLGNWDSELRKWCPYFSITTIYSEELKSLGKAGLPRPFNVLLVSYKLFERFSLKKEEYNVKVLKLWQWSCVIMDEAHVLKDKKKYERRSNRWRNLTSVAQNARQRLMLTGMPLQNDLRELWSLLEFMMPDIFATGDVDLKKLKLLNVEDSDLIVRIKSILGPFILRRLKSDVMQHLVPKIHHVWYAFMGKEQSDTYRDAIDKYRRLTKSMGMSNNVDLLPKRQISNYFMKLRKIANHPLLLRRIHSDKDVVRIATMLTASGVISFDCTLVKAIQELADFNDFQIHKISTRPMRVLTDEHLLGSAKYQALVELLPLLDMRGHRALIFSQWTEILDILEWTLDTIGVIFKRLDDRSKVREKQSIVDAFNNDRSIFACLLSTRAAGQGLNFIGADTVIIHDMSFNPQMDRQAVDSCLHIGQTKPINVYRLVTKDTVDEDLYKIARRNLVLDAAVESGTELDDDDNNVPERTMGEILSALLSL